MPYTGCSFVILKQVDSTNNYAMAKVHAGLAKHGDGWFSNHQTAGKGQRGKLWLTTQGQNIALSVVFSPKQLKIINPFLLSTSTALGVLDFFSFYAGDETKIKWPNDIYWRDRKAGGILIENNYNGKDWKWAVLGIGVNINQVQFDDQLINPVSLQQITGKSFDTIELGKHLHQLILKRADELLTKPYAFILNEYNLHLYKRYQQIKLKKDNRIFETIIKGVTSHGQLITEDAIEKQYEFGEIEWIV